MAGLATGAEVVGACALLIGLGVRWMSIPLMVTMAVAMLTTHWHNGWQAIADPKSAFANDQAAAAVERLSRAKDILKEHGNYDWLTETGNFVVLNNGIEFAATYFVMLLALFLPVAAKPAWIICLQRATDNRIVPAGHGQSMKKCRSTGLSEAESTGPQRIATIPSRLVRRGTCVPSARQYLSTAHTRF